MERFCAVWKTKPLLYILIDKNVFILVSYNTNDKNVVLPFEENKKYHNSVINTLMNFKVHQGHNIITIPSSIMLYIFHLELFLLSLTLFK